VEKEKKVAAVSPGRAGGLLTFMPILNLAVFSHVVPGTVKKYD
jgi:hypothetical protein